MTACIWTPILIYALWHPSQMFVGQKLIAFDCAVVLRAA